MIYCYSEDNSVTDEYNTVGKGIYSIGCYFLSPGSSVQVVILTIKQNSAGEGSTSEGVILPIKTSD